MRAQTVVRLQECRRHRGSRNRLRCGLGVGRVFGWALVARGVGVRNPVGNLVAVSELRPVKSINRHADCSSPRIPTLACLTLVACEPSVSYSMRTRRIGSEALDLVLLVSAEVAFE